MILKAQMQTVGDKTVPLLSQLQFRINEMVWNMHNNTNFTEISQFWDHLGWRL